MNIPDSIARRTFLRSTGISLGSIAFNSLLADHSFAKDIASPKEMNWQGAINPLHFKPKAKRIIWL